MQALTSDSLPHQSMSAPFPGRPQFHPQHPRHSRNPRLILPASCPSRMGGWASHAETVRCFANHPLSAFAPRKLEFYSDTAQAQCRQTYLPSCSSRLCASTSLDVTSTSGPPRLRKICNAKSAGPNALKEQPATAVAPPTSDLETSAKSIQGWFTGLHAGIDCPRGNWGAD